MVLFINSLCTCNCFYCPQDRKIKKELPPVDDGIIFDDPKVYVDYLGKFNFKGVGFSGGEPLLVFDKLLEYIKRIRERFGEKLYLWLYTNGSLVNKEKLQRLKAAGLNEIRFDISAKNYDLQPVELAVNIIDTVTVEIPAIPEDKNLVKECLPKLQKTGIKYLNIHQLNATEHNYKNYIARNYTFLHRPSIPILESEIAALELIRYALENKISLPINYCSSVYKNRLQGKGKRKRFAPLVKDEFEEITHNGYIRSLSIQDSPTSIKKIIKILQEKRYPDNLTISYFQPQLKTALSPNEKGKEVILNSKKFFLTKELVAQQKELTPVVIQSFVKLFIENMDESEVLNYLYRNYNLKTKEDLKAMKKEIELLQALKTWEHLEAGFPEIY